MDRDRAAAVVLGNKDIKNDLRVRIQLDQTSFPLCTTLLTSTAQEEARPDGELAGGRRHERGGRLRDVLAPGTARIEVLSLQVPEVF